MAGSEVHSGNNTPFKSCKSECEMIFGVCVCVCVLPGTEMHSEKYVRPKTGSKNGGKVNALSLDTNLGNDQSLLRTANVLRFCVW